MKYPLAQYSEEPVTDYPLTKDELRALAAHWSYEYLDTSVFCCFAGQVGSTDLRMWDYMADRLKRIAAILGQEEIEKVHAEVEERMRQRLGEEGWTAFREGRAVFREEIEAEYAQKEADVKKIKDA